MGGVDFPEEDLIVSSRVPKINYLSLSPPHFPSSHSVLITIVISSDASNIQSL